MKLNQRFIELDIWRAMAVFGMVIFHLIFLLNYFDLYNFKFYEGGWFLLARLVQWSFLLVVGISLNLSYQKSRLHQEKKSGFISRQLKRGALVLLLGLLITIITRISIPGEYVRFGILHLIGTSIILLAFIADRPILAALLSLLIYILSFPIHGYTVSNPFFVIFGFHYPFKSVDHFPLFPWLGIPALGIFLSSLLYKNYQRNFNTISVIPKLKFVDFMVFMGRNSLVIYLVHFPMLIGILLLVKQLY